MIGRIIPAGDLSSNGGLIRGAEYAAFKIKQRLQFLRGEWFWNTRLGIPYFQQILVKGPNLELVRGIYRSELLKVPGIVRVDPLTLGVDEASRLLSVQFSATYQDETGVFVSIEGAIP